MCADGRSDRKVWWVLTGFSGGRHCELHRVCRCVVSGTVVGRDVMCSCVQYFVIVRTAYTL
jgi:hypothetical protein